MAMMQPVLTQEMLNAAYNRLGVRPIEPEEAYPIEPSCQEGYDEPPLSNVRINGPTVGEAADALMDIFNRPLDDKEMVSKRNELNNKPKYVAGIRASKEGDITCGMCPYMRDGVCDKHKHGLGYNVKVYKTWTCDKAERKA